MFISSHVLDQLERMVTRYGVIRDGVLVREMTAEEVDAECADYLSIRVAEPQVALAKLQDAFPQATFNILADDAIRAEGGLNPNQVGYALSEAGIPITELYVHERDIEELFVSLMGEDTSQGGTSHAGAPAANSFSNQGGGRNA